MRQLALGFTPMHYAAVGSVEIMKHSYYYLPKQKQNIYTVYSKPLKSGDIPSVKQSVRNDLK